GVVRRRGGRAVWARRGGPRGRGLRAPPLFRELHPRDLLLHLSVELLDCVAGDRFLFLLRRLFIAAGCGGGTLRFFTRYAVARRRLLFTRGEDTGVLRLSGLGNETDSQISDLCHHHSFVRVRTGSPHLRSVWCGEKPTAHF